MNIHALVVEELRVAEYLHFKEELVDGEYDTDPEFPYALLYLFMIM